MEYEKPQLDALLPRQSERIETLIPHPPSNPPPARRYPRQIRGSRTQHRPRCVMKLQPIAPMNIEKSTYITSRCFQSFSSLQPKPKPKPDASTVKSVLYVDDEKIQRIVMTKILDACEVVAIITATDGMKGLAAMQKNAFELVISDLEMPTMDGREMIRSFRAWEDDRPYRQRVVCLTGADVSDESLLEAGFDEVLRKPVTKDKINALLHRGVTT